MRPSILCVALVGCGPAPVDVSDLSCAGLEDPDGNVLVSTVAEDGCTGASVSGHFECDGCSFEVGDPIMLAVAYGGRYYQECLTTTLDEAGDFSFGRVAPALGYLTNYQWGAKASGLVTFGVCSDPVFVSDVVEPDPCDGCTE